MLVVGNKSDAVFSAKVNPTECRLKLYLFDEQTSDPLGLLVQLRAGQRLRDGALAVEEREQDVVGRRVVSPAEDLGDVVVATAAAFRGLLFEAADVAAGR